MADTTPEAAIDFAAYICPGCDQPLPLTYARQRQRLLNGGKVYHSRECQKAASSETRPCDNCGNRVTRRRCEFGPGKVACSNACKGALKANSEEVPCETCGVPVARTPGNRSEHTYCSRTCAGVARRSERAIQVNCGGCGILFTVRESPRIRSAQQGKPVYHSRECQKENTRVELPCANCGTPIWRYRSKLEAPDGRKVRSYCDTCRDSGHGAKPCRGNEKPCGTCGEPVYRKPSEDDGGERYCNKKCYGKSLEGERVPREEKPCETCSETMRLTPDQSRQGVRTCSRKCTATLKRRKPGERYIEPSGYVRITTPDGRDMFEHRYVMEQHLGRRLRKDETVHHKKGGFAGRSNNDLSNLELWSGRHPKGHRIEDILAYSQEMLELYAAEEEYR